MNTWDMSEEHKMTAKDKNNILATYNFGGNEIPAIVSKNYLIGCQFHPEKSSTQGLKLISNFLKFV